MVRLREITDALWEQIEPLLAENGGKVAGGEITAPP
jgi:hypothetical protein